VTGLPRGKGRGAILRRWLLAGLAPSALEAQAVFVDGPTTQPLPSITPALQVRAVGLGPGPIQYTVQIATVADYSALVLDSTFTATDTALTVQVHWGPRQPR